MRNERLPSTVSTDKPTLVNSVLCGCNQALQECDGHRIRLGDGIHRSNLSWRELVTSQSWSLQQIMATRSTSLVVEGTQFSLDETRRTVITRRSGGKTVQSSYRSHHAPLFAVALSSPVYRLATVLWCPAWPVSASANCIEWLNSVDKSMAMPARSRIVSFVIPTSISSA